MGVYTASGEYPRAGRFFDRVIAERGVDAWSADDAYQFAHLAFIAPDDSATSSRYRQAGALLGTAVRTWSDGEAEARAPAISSLCADHHPGADWCRAILDSLVLLRPTSAYFPLYFGTIRSQSDNKKMALEALTLLDTAEARLGRSLRHTDQTREMYAAWIHWSQARAHLTLAEYGERRRLATSERLVKGALALQTQRPPAEVASWPNAGDVYSTLLDVYMLDGRFAQVDSVLVSPPRGMETGSFWSTRHFIHLARGERDAVLRVSDSALASNPSDPSALFVASISRLLTERPDADSTARQFITETEHEYRDYVRLMLYASLMGKGAKEEADTLLSERLAQIDTATWATRLVQGDRTVWREMLVLYYAGKLPPDDVVGPLSDPARYERSRLHAFDFPLDGLRCEAYFYDAVLQGVTGPPESRRQRQLARLDRALATNYQLYYEYHMAHMLRDRIRAASVTR